MPSAQNLGVALPEVSAGRPNAKRFAERLIDALKTNGALSVSLVDSSDKAKARRAARDKNVGFILFTTISVKDQRSAAERIGGILGTRFPQISIPRPEGGNADSLVSVEYSIEEVGKSQTLARGKTEQKGANANDVLEALATQLSDEILSKVRGALPPAPTTPANVAADRQPASSAAQTVSSEQPRLVVQTSHSAMVIDFQYTPDGALLATLGVDGTMKLWTTESRKEIRTLAGYRIAGLSMAPKGDRLATIDHKGTIRIVDMLTGSVIDTFRGDVSADKSEASGLGLFMKPIPIVFGQDGKTIVHGGDDGASVWDVPSRRLMRTLGKGSPVGALAISRDGSMVAVSLASGESSSFSISLKDSGSAEASIQTYRTSGGLLKQFPPRVSAVTTMTFSPDGKQLFIGSRNGSVLAFDPVSGNAVGAPLVSNKCDQLSAAGSGAGTLQDIIRIGAQGCEGINLVKAMKAGGILGGLARGIRSVDISPDGRLLAYGLGDNTIVLRDVANRVNIPLDQGGPVGGNSQENATVPFFWAIAPVKFGADSFGMYVSSIRNFKTIARWDVMSGKAVSSLALSNRDLLPFPIPIPLGSVPVFTSGGDALVTATLSAGTKLWNLRSGGPPEHLSDDVSMINSVPLSPDGKVIVRTKPDAKDPGLLYVTLNEFGSEKEIRELPKRYGGFVIPSFSPDSRFVTLTGLEQDGKWLRVYDVAKGAEVFSRKDVEGAAFAPNSARLALRLADGQIVVKDTARWNSDVFKTKLASGETSLPQSMVFSTDTSLLASSDGNSLKVWDLSNGKLMRERKLEDNFDLSNLVFVPNQRRITYTTDRSLHHWDLESNQVRTSSMSTDFWGNLAYSPDGRILALGGAENRIRLFDVAKDKEVGSLIAPNQKDWLVVTPDWRMDTRRLEEIEEIHWILNDEPFRAQPFELFTREYFEPRLLSRLLNGESFQPIPDLSSRNRAVPQVEISSITQEGPDKVKITVGVRSTSGKFVRNASSVTLKSGAQKIRLFRDGRLVGHAMDPGDADALGNKDQAEVTFSVDLPKSAGRNQVEFTAFAYNVDDVRGPAAKRTYDLPARSGARGRAYIVSVGVEKTNLGLFDVDFAASDARLLSGELARNLRNVGSYSNVVEIQLISDGASDMATKTNVRAVLEMLSGHPERVPDNVRSRIPNVSSISRATPDDLIVLSFSAHGFTDTNGVFYILPADLGTNLGPAMNDYAQKAISSDDLSVWLRDIDAGDLVLVIDSCEAEAAVYTEGFKPGPFGSRGLGQLAYDKGAQIIAGAQLRQAAYSNSKLKNGYLTYALGQQGLAQSAADFRTTDKKIFVAEWLQYGVKEVPALFGTGGAQAQQPVLFDFLWNRADRLIATVP